MNRVLASISILTSNRQVNSPAINQILNNYSFLITARLGLNVQKKCTEKCLAIILLAIEGKQSEIDKMLKKLKEIDDLKLKFNILKSLD